MHYWKAYHFTTYILIQFLEVTVDASSSDEEDEEDLVAGIFQSRKNKLAKKKNALFHSRDCSKAEVEKDQIDVALDEIKQLIKDCFVTGKWNASEDAQKLLDDDEMEGIDFVIIEICIKADTV